MGLLTALRRDRDAPAQQERQPVQAVTALPPAPGVPPVMSHGLLDGAPPPHGPDVTVFGGWQPSGDAPWGESVAWECCGVRGAPGRCWNCGRP